MIVVYSHTTLRTNTLFRFRGGELNSASYTSRIVRAETFGPSASVWMVPGTCPDTDFD